MHNPLDTIKLIQAVGSKVIEDVAAERVARLPKDTPRLALDYEPFRRVMSARVAVHSVPARPEHGPGTILIATWDGYACACVVREIKDLSRVGAWHIVLDPLLS